MSEHLVVVNKDTLTVTECIVWGGDAKTKRLLTERRKPNFVIAVDTSLVPIHVNKTIYDDTTKTFTTPLDPIPESKLLLVAETVKFQTIFVTNVSIDGRTIPVQVRDAKDLLNLEALKTMAELGEGCAFRDADNNMTDLTAEQVIDLYNQVVSNHLSYTRKCSEVRALIKAGTLTTVDDVRNCELWQLA